MPNAAKPDRATLSGLPNDRPEAASGPAEASESSRAALERRSPCPQRPAWARPSIGHTRSPWALRAGSGALPLIPGTAPRRRIATGRDQTQREPPPLPRPSSPAPLHRGHRRRWATSPCSAVQQQASGPRKTPAPRKPSGTQSPRQALPPGAPGLALPAAPPRPAGAPSDPKAQSSRRGSGRRLWPKAGRRGAGNPGSRREPPCPAPVRRPPQRPPCGARGDRQGLRPLRPGR